MRGMGDTLSATLNVPGLSQVTDALGLTQTAQTVYVQQPATGLAAISTRTWCWIGAGALALYLLTRRR